MAQRGKRVPQTRLGRLTHMARLASGVAGGMLAEGGRRLAAGELPNPRDMLVTPANARRLADQLANLRGAAMKLGQLLSMDGGELLPPALAEILARLRQDASPIPERQLRKTLNIAWGKDWENRLRHFDWQPIAAASIGQVHRAVRKDGAELAVKVQYPGIRKSIDSDVDNVATLLRVARLLPPQVDLDSLLLEAKRQLHEEADYHREARHLVRFGELLADDADFLVPDFDAEFSGRSVLAMTLVGGDPVESLRRDRRSLRDRVCTLLITLLFRELFDFRLVQTDPNFANFRYDRDSEQLILLDFGASRPYSKKIARAYRALFRAAIEDDMTALEQAALDIGYFADGSDSDNVAAVVRLFRLAMEPLRHQGPYDFARSSLPARIAEAGMKTSLEEGFWHTPPPDAIFLHRKLGGLYLLAARLQARVDLSEILWPYVFDDDTDA